jgi:hypothetical protein
MTPEGDTVGRLPDSGGLMGVLPGGVPDDLPIYEPSSVVDFEERAGVGWVRLSTPNERPAVEASLREALDRAGWRAAGDPWTRTKADRTVRLSVRPAPGGGSEIEIRY